MQGKSRLIINNTINNMSELLTKRIRHTVLCAVVNKTEKVEEVAPAR
ncbi:hypothetical protein A2U01_0020008, partial [Trifolium medium]|nr:hypothetical protein [Trifolium medium]